MTNIIQSMRSFLAMRYSLGMALVFGAGNWVLDQNAQAQCCWGNKSPAAYPVGSPYPIANPAQAGAYSAGRPMIPVVPITPSNGANSSYYGNYGMLPPATGNVLPNGFEQTVASAMPTAAYDTQWQRTPVTYYRPVTQFDPNYGTTVTSLQPCTSYQYQAQRVPMVAPTPVGGAYAQASNQWPAINQPGYYPSGMANAYAISPLQPAVAGSTTPLNASVLPAAPVYPQVQYLPSNGTSVPASATGFPNAGSGLSSAVYYGNPASAAPVAPSANCPGGVCPTNTAASGNLAPPSIPGATSITPLGPVTYIPSGSGVAQAGFAQPGGTVPSSNGLVVPPSSGATLDPAAGVAPSLPPPPTGAFGVPSKPSSETPNTSMMPSHPVLPSDSTGPSTSSAGLWSDGDQRVAKMVPMNRLPVVAIDRPATNTTPGYPTSRWLDDDPAAIASPFPGASSKPIPSASSESSLVPRSAAPSSSSKAPLTKPLMAPEGFDGKPHWNPKLLPSSSDSAQDKVAWRAANSTK